ncbi:hypothetical protein [Sphaerisporangium aureirubrum]|uniref:Uncharacterized protein n=1 Tax=Sphaerisporangium aureirubrum TaxID=1544736 RepID=A0ABW1NLW5_9ACTN
MTAPVPPLPSAITDLIIQQIDALHRLYPAWHFTRATRPDGTPGAWLATRRTPPTHSQRAAGLLPTLDRPDAVALVMALAVQEEIEHPTGRVPDASR